MDLNKLYKMQEELDKHILEKHNIKMSKEELLDNTILALLVEVGELANTTRCFKHWSTKGMMDKEVILDELADVLHFYLSIGNQLGLNKGLNSDIFEGEMANRLPIIFLKIYEWIHVVDVVGNVKYKKMAEDDKKGIAYQYNELGAWIRILWSKMQFTDEEVEQAYLKKHEENYKRQREGY